MTKDEVQQRTSHLTVDFDDCECILNIETHNGLDRDWFEIYTTINKLSAIFFNLDEGILAKVEIINHPTTQKELP